MTSVRQKKYIKMLKRILLMIGVISVFYGLKILVTPSQFLLVTYLGLMPILLFALKLTIIQFVKKKALKYKKLQDKLEKQRLKQAERNQVKVWKNENERFYRYTQHMLHDLIQQGRMTRRQIKEFNNLIDEHLANDTEQYNHMKFKNEAHMIYTKLHSYSLNPYNYVQLINYLEEIASNTSNANHRNYKGVNRNVINFKRII